MNGWPVCAGAATSWMCTCRGDERLTTHDHVLDDLDQVEAGVAHDRRDTRSPAQIDRAPEGAEEGGGDCGVHALQQVPRSERGARYGDADRRPTEPDGEAVQQKRALDFLADAAGH